jgi:GTPase SAR1 family protein
VSVGLCIASKKLDENVKMEIWDTEGSEKYNKSLPPNYFRDSAGVLLCFDLSDESSLNNLIMWH